MNRRRKRALQPVPAARITPFTTSSNLKCPAQGPEPRARATIELLVLLAALLHQHTSDWLVTVAIKMAGAELTLQIPVILVLWLIAAVSLLRRRR